MLVKDAFVLACLYILPTGVLAPVSRAFNSYWNVYVFLIMQWRTLCQILGANLLF